MADQTFQNVINGELVDAAVGRDLRRHRPDHRRGLRRSAPMSGPRTSTGRTPRPPRPFETWGDTTPQDRAQALLKIADAIEARAEEINAVECKDTGKPLGLTMSRGAAATPPTTSGSSPAPPACSRAASAGEYMADHTSWVRREPVGVVGQVTPWNYPLMMMIWKIAPALAGRQHDRPQAQSTPRPRRSTLLAELCQEFLPPGVLNVVCGDRDTGRALVEHKTPQMVAITGSVRAGMEVAGSAAADLKRVHLELGGKAPVIVFDDADIEKAAEGIAGAGYFNAGQDCTAATRVLAGPGVHDDFVAALTEQAKDTKTGMPDDEDVALRPAQQRRTSSTGSPAWSTGCPTTPRVDDRRPPAGRRAATSTSRPCSPACSRTTSRSRTRSSARSSPCRSSPTRPRRCAGPTASSTAWPRRSGPRTTAARCGCPSASTSACVWINTHIPFVSEMPHGGFKHSGYGKDLSMYGLEDYTRIKHVMSYIGE